LCSWVAAGSVDFFSRALKMNYSTDSDVSSEERRDIFIKSYKSAFRIISTTFLVSILSGSEEGDF